MTMIGVETRYHVLHAPPDDVQLPAQTQTDI